MKLIISNHKMNLTVDQVKEYVEKLKTINSSNNKLVFCPSYLYLPYFKGDNYSLGCQNVADRHMGALTGEISIEQVKSLSVEYAIIGHSERRNILNETNELIQKKVTLCLEHDITPVLCIGEKEEEMSYKEQILEEEIKSVFSNVSNPERIVIAYEPIWAIGTGKVPTNEEINQTLLFIKNYIKDNFQVDCLTLYGGSVSDKNIIELKEVPSIDGYLIGGTSLDLSKLKVVIQELEG